VDWIGLDHGVNLCLWLGSFFLVYLLERLMFIPNPHISVLAKCQLFNFRLIKSVAHGCLTLALVSDIDDDDDRYEGIISWWSVRVIDKEKVRSQKRSYWRYAPIHNDATTAQHVAGRETDQDSGQPKAARPAAGT
jgi:hypothetical protein